MYYILEINFKKWFVKKHNNDGKNVIRITEMCISAKLSSFNFSYFVKVFCEKKR